MQNKYIKFLIIALAVVIVIFGGFFAYFSWQKNKTMPNDAWVPTAGWKTYINNEQNFKIDYPPEFAIDENGDYPANGDIIVTFRRPSYGDWTFGVAGATKDAMAQYISFFKDENGFQQKTINVAGKKSQEFSYIDKRDRNIKKVAIYIPKDNGEYLSINWKSSEDISETQKIQNAEEQLNQILFTVKFTK